MEWLFQLCSGIGGYCIAGAMAHEALTGQEVETGQMPVVETSPPEVSYESEVLAEADAEQELEIENGPRKPSDAQSRGGQVTIAERKTICPISGPDKAFRQGQLGPSDIYAMDQAMSSRDLVLEQGLVSEPWKVRRQWDNQRSGVDVHCASWVDGDVGVNVEDSGDGRQNVWPQHISLDATRVLDRIESPNVEDEAKDASTMKEQAPVQVVEMELVERDVERKGLVDEKIGPVKGPEWA
eukprot:s3343_g2.t1